MKYFCGLLFVSFGLLLQSAEANKKLQRIILASLIGKTLKSHMGHQSAPSIVPIMMPPFRSMEKHIETPHNNGLMHNNNAGLVSNGVVHTNHQVVAAPAPTITVHHYHHHTTNHNTIDSHGDDGYDAISYNHLVESPIVIHQDYNSYADTHDHLGGFNKAIGYGSNSILSGSLGGSIGNILSGQIGGQLGR